MYKTDFNASQQGRDTGSVCWQAAQKVRHDGCRSDWCLEHSDERVAVDWLHDLSLFAVRGSHSQRLPALDGRPDNWSEGCCPSSEAGLAAEPDAGG